MNPTAIDLAFPIVQGLVVPIDHGHCLLGALKAAAPALLEVDLAVHPLRGSGLPADLQLSLKRRMQVFLAEKPFIGCAGLEVTDEMRVVIAAQACLLILGRRTDYFANLRQILVYPGAFIVDRVHADSAGVLQDRRQVLSGESWSQGQVILSWDDVVAGAAIADDGRNVVIHEFAHQLDQQKGFANGAPWLGQRDRYARWSRVLGEEFGRLQAQVTTGQPSLFSDYGATDPAEFFAVVSEVFFEQPREMATLHPSLYDELRILYRVDPLAWPGMERPATASS
jgi:Mlc titration factor MtfA (ptsG expression regulator)